VTSVDDYITRESGFDRDFSILIDFKEDKSIYIAHNPVQNKTKYLVIKNNVPKYFLKFETALAFYEKDFFVISNEN
jgi:hypothetical protein